MPVVDYSKVVIYKIQHESKDELLYVGSTTHFGNRKVQHKRSCYNANGKSYNSKLYSTIRDNGGWDSFSMVVVKEFPCKNKQEALSEEDRVMRQMRSSLNSIRAYTTPEERQEYYKEYREQNRDRFKEYREQNPRIEYNKEYHEHNKTRRNIYHKEYYYKNRDKAHEKHTCLCGGRYTHQHKASHFKSKKHQEYLNQQTDQ